MSDHPRTGLRRSVLCCAILTVLAADASADISGPISGGVGGVQYGDDVTIQGDLVGGTADVTGLTVDGDADLTGNTRMTSTDGSAAVTVSDALVEGTVNNRGGGENGLVVTATDSTLSGGDDNGNTLMIVDQDAVRITGEGGSLGNLSVAGEVTANGITNTGNLANTGSLVNTGDSSLTSSDGAANLSLADSTAGLTVQNLVGGANGIVVNAADTTLSGGDDSGTTSLLITQDGLAVTGNGTSTGNLSVAGQMAANGITNTGNFATTGNAAVGGNLAVVGQTATSGITNTGNFATTGNAAVGGNLAVVGQTATSGITNTGNFATTGNAAVGGNLAVVGQTATSGITNTGNFATTGNAAVGGNLAVVGQTATSGITNTGDFQTTGDSTLRSQDGTTGVIVTDGLATVGVKNARGSTNGLAVTRTSTTITGGTGTTKITVDDSGVAITGTGPSTGNLTVQGTTNLQGSLNLRGGLQVAPNQTVNFGGNRLQNIAPGEAATDAVNMGQFSSLSDQVEDNRTEARRGIAIAAALDTHLPDPGKRFRLNLGGGVFNGESALGLTGAGRVNDDVAVYFGIGADTGFHETTGKIGVSYQW